MRGRPGPPVNNDRPPAPSVRDGPPSCGGASTRGSPPPTTTSGRARRRGLVAARECWTGVSQRRRGGGRRHGEVLRRQRDDSIAVVARSLGEGHWAEQLAVLRGRLMLDALITEKGLAAAERGPRVPFVEGRSPRWCETVGLCHYLGFADDDRSDFRHGPRIARSRAAESRRTTLVSRRAHPRDAFILKPPRINKRGWS